MFFESWWDIFRVFVSCLFAYSALVLLLRASGKRTLSKWNAFDFIVTIALGSILASVILSESTAIAEGIFASFLLIIFQFIITKFSIKFEWIEDIIKACPTLLYYQDEFLKDAMGNQRVTKAEILAAIRNSSIGEMNKVEAVVLETDGSFSVIEKSESDDDTDSALEDVEGFEEQKKQQN